MFEKFEVKVDSLKRKIDDKILVLVIFGIFVLLTIYSLESTRLFKKNKDLLENEYTRSMCELVQYMKNIDLQFKKIRICSNSSLIETTLADIWRESNLAKENLANLPVTQNTLSNTSKYLSQTSDFAYSLMKKLANDKEITEKENEQLIMLSNYSQKLYEITTNIYNDVVYGRLTWDDVKKSGEKNLDEVEEISNLQEVSKIFQDYEGLIYDGAFSNSIKDREAVYIKDMERISIEQAEEKLKEIFDEENIEKMEFDGEIDNSINLYSFTIKLKNCECEKSILLTQKGGVMYGMLSNRNVENSNLSIEDAKIKATEFLKKIGVDSVEDTYYMITDNYIMLNYAYVEDDVIMYPDLIKVKVALDNGEVASCEMEGYVYNHREREIAYDVISKESIQEYINKNVEITKIRRAVIPTDFNTEIDTYEIKGKIQEDDCLIYINVNQLKEEKILMLTKLENGVLAM